MGIPCIPPDINGLTNLIKNVNNQSRLPDEIIISHSESSNKQGLRLQEHLNQISESPVKVITTTNKAYAGFNRNIIANHSNSEYISYIDADDLMHPERIKIIAQTLVKYNKPIGSTTWF